MGHRGDTGDTGKPRVAWRDTSCMEPTGTWLPQAEQLVTRSWGRGFESHVECRGYLNEQTLKAEAQNGCILGQVTKPGLCLPSLYSETSLETSLHLSGRNFLLSTDEVICHVGSSPPPRGAGGNRPGKTVLLPPEGRSPCLNQSSSFASDFLALPAFL